jgi:hypothetical protein
MLLIGCDKLLNRLSQAFESLRSIVFDRLEHKNKICVPQAISFFSVVTPNNDVSLEIQRRIQTANRCFFGLRKQLQSRHLSRPTKFIIYKTLIRPVLLYGSETWVWTKREENHLLVFERKLLRMICGPKLENGVYRRRYNFELQRRFIGRVS